MLSSTRVRRGVVGLAAAAGLVLAIGAPAGPVPNTGSISSLDLVLDSSMGGPDVVFEVPDTTSSPVPPVHHG